MKLIFLVQGSANEPYYLEFWRDQNNLTSTCTCQAGQKGMYCKHRLHLLDGQTENLRSDNQEDVKKLQELLKGTDVEESLLSIKKSESASQFLTDIYQLNPDRRRAKINLELAKDALLKSGVIKSNGDSKYLDVYDNYSQYIGSIKLNNSVFKDELSDIIPDIDMRKIVKYYKGMPSVYYYLVGSNMDKNMEEESRLSEYKQKLKVTLKD